MFGQGPPKSMSYSSMGLFATRDSMTILASFSLPGLLSKRLQNSVSINPSTSDNFCQLITPVSMQILSTPLHLLGLTRIITLLYPFIDVYCLIQAWICIIVQLLPALKEFNLSAMNM